jgi:hypothetical protein
MDAKSTKTVVAFRRHRFQLILELKKAKMPEFSEPVLFTQLSNTYLFDAAIYLQEEKFPGLATQPEHFGEWWTPLQHKILIIHALLQEAFRSPTEEELWLLANSLSLSLIQYCREEVARFSPELAKAIPQATGWTLFCEGTMQLQLEGRI